MLKMDIIHQGTDDVFGLESLECCFPAGTMSRSISESTEEK